MPETLQTAMAQSSFYGPDVKAVRLIQTHISTVALTGTYAYKVKKPVNFGFLDFSTLEKRKKYCDEELRLNRRLCPDIYLDVLPITHDHNGYHLNGPGPVVDYAVKMKEFPQDRIMTTMLKDGTVTTEMIDQLCERLVQFYTADTPTDEIRAQGRLDAIKQNIDENFEQTAGLIDVTIPADTYEFIRTACHRFFTDNPTVFSERILDGRIHDCHGDLHSGNIVDIDGLCVFDCIEFNTRFRYCDVVSDIGFLAMDLDFHNHPYLASHLIRRYVELSGDHNVYHVLNFYKSYRAYVRGKVLGFRIDDPHLKPEEKQSIITTAQQYYALSRYYASLFDFDLDRTRPVLFLVAGLTGTGKSTVAEKLAVDYGAHLLNTDVVRKELAGIDPYERHHDQLDTGLYSPTKVLATYQTMVDLGSTMLGRGDDVVLDATFQKEEYRRLALSAAEANHAILAVVHCQADDTIVKHRLEQRLKKKSVSDGRWEIYLGQKKTFEPFVAPLGVQLEFNTGNESYEYRLSSFQNLTDMLREAG